jgi:RHS repeat-associated protein
LGSTRRLTNAAGSTTDTAIYDAWGNMANRTGSTSATLLWIGAAGYYTDSETSAYHVRRRPYAPVTARWMVLDFVDATTVVNRYLYVDNRPIALVDPAGLQVINIPQGPGPITPAPPGGAINILKKLNCDCREGEVFVNQPPPLGFPAGAIMYVDCKNNKMVPTVVPGNPAVDAFIAAAKKCGVYKCLVAHENEHIAHFSQFCKDTCKGADPNKVFLVGFIGASGGQCTAVSECYAYAVGIICMIKRACAIAAALQAAPNPTLRYCWRNLMNWTGPGTTVIRQQMNLMQQYCTAAGLDGAGLISNINDWRGLQGGRPCGGAAGGGPPGGIPPAPLGGGPPGGIPPAPLGGPLPGGFPPTPGSPPGAPPGGWPPGTGPTTGSAGAAPGGWPP